MEILTIIGLISLVSFLGCMEVLSFEKIFRIKWELIIAILLFISMVLTFSIIDTKDYRTFVLFAIPTFLFISWIVNYNKIKEIREFLLRTW